MRAMGYGPPGPFVTSILELKLDQNTMCEWQRFSQDQTDVPHYQDLLDFIDLRAQASETMTTESQRKSVNKGEVPFKRNTGASRPVTSYAASAVNNTSSSQCIICKPDKHPLYLCPKFKVLPHSEKVTILKTNDVCMNCLRPGHFINSCKSHHRCRVCQRPHHSLLHMDSKPTHSEQPTPTTSSIT